MAWIPAQNYYMKGEFALNISGLVLALFMFGSKKNKTSMGKSILQ